MKLKLTLAVLAAAILTSCIKSRECQCHNSVTQKTEVFFINGNQKDAKNACKNLADSTETCSLKP